MEDDLAVRASMAEILRRRGFRVSEAGDGVAATWMVAAGEFDVLVLDLRLSHLDGTAVLESLEPPGTAVVVSAFSCDDEGAIRDSFGSKVFACLRKPVDPERLVEVVSSASEAGLGPRVRPIEPRDALRLGLAGLASLGPPDRAPMLRSPSGAS
ncbi:MAG: response regulator [Acidobacteriota bacterium]|nr:response regulator [Acidobacteriota bacterium]